MFGSTKLAAELTKIVKDPFDAQHLLIDSMRFVKDENWIQFEVKSSQEVERKDTTVKKGTPPVKEKKVFYFEYIFTWSKACLWIDERIFLLYVV
jgi:dipeptidyl-peptidase-4